MKRLVLVAVLVAAVWLPATVQAAPSEESCWGQATQTYTRQEPGLLGQHSSEQTVPRVGLRNLARSLHDGGVLDDDSMQALGAFVAAEEGLEVDACERE